MDSQSANYYFPPTLYTQGLKKNYLRIITWNHRFIGRIDGEWRTTNRSHSVNWRGWPVNSLGGDVIVVASTMIERIVYGAQGMHGGVQSSWHRGI